MRPFFKREDKDNQENINKTPSKMARLAWPKAKYGAIIAIIIIIVGNLIYYKDFFLSIFSWICDSIIYGKKFISDC